MIPHNDSMRVTSNVTVELWALVDTFHTTGYLLVKKQAYAIALKNQVLLVAINNKNPGWVWKNTKFEIPCRVRVIRAGSLLSTPPSLSTSSEMGPHCNDLLGGGEHYQRLR